jgi:uncharacterized protein
MKLLPDASGSHSITGYGPGWVSVNGEKFTSNLFVSPQDGTTLWQCPGFEELQAEHFDVFASIQPELVVFGSGDQFRLLHPRILQKLYALRIGVETMDTQAACRTFNFLAGEGRRVIAALLV